MRAQILGMLGELSAEQIERVLHGQVLGRIGCHAAGRTYVVPVTYAYDGQAVYAHSGEGLKLQMMRASPEVCFEVEEVDDLARWRSVIAWGRFEELHGEAAAAGMRVLLGRLMPLMTSETAQPSHGLSAAHRTDTSGKSALLYRIVLGEKTGRFEKR